MARLNITNHITDTNAPQAQMREDKKDNMFLIRTHSTLDRTTHHDSEPVENYGPLSDLAGDARGLEKQPECRDKSLPTYKYKKSKKESSSSSPVWTDRLAVLIVVVRQQCHGARHDIPDTLLALAETRGNSLSVSVSLCDGQV